jgi:hypothetical protein
MEYNNFKLRFYSSFQDYVDKENIEFCFQDANNEIVDIDNFEDLVLLSKTHLSDETPKPEQFYWEADTCEQSKGIICVLLYNSDKVKFKDILVACAHELGHLVDGSNFRNSTFEYYTPEGYQEEEEKAMAFEKLAKDSYEIAEYFCNEISNLGIKIEK